MVNREYCRDLYVLISLIRSLIFEKHGMSSLSDNLQV